MRSATTQRNRTLGGLGRARALALALVLAVATTLAAASAAPASRSETTLFDLGGFALDVDETQRAELLGQLQDFGVDSVRVIVTWREIAPDPDAASKPSFDATDPGAYPAHWAALDDLVRGAQQRGMDVVLTPSGPAPDWATSPHDGLSNPNPSDFQQFVQALGTRYSGNYSPPPALPTDPANPVLPRVSRWSVWNEPNLTLFLKPQIKHGKSVAAKIYRNLFLAAKRGLQATNHGSDQLLIGETSPSSGRKGTDPISFLRGVFCLNAKFKRTGGCSAIDADGWAQHPYDPFDAPFEKGTHKLINLATIGNLETALRKARAAHATTSRLPVYVTEYGVESVPDRKYGVSQLRQAEYISISEYLMYGDPQIRSYGQYLMTDDPGREQVNFQTGLRFSDGRQKISYSSFPLALVAQRRSKKSARVTIWGHVRPKGGPLTVTIQSRGPGPAHTLKTVHTTAGGYFQFSTPFRKGRRYSASTRLPDGTELTGPFVRSYVFK